MNMAMNRPIVLLAGVATFLLGFAATSAAEPPAPASLLTSQPDTAAAKDSPAAKTRFVAAHKEADKAKTGPDGLAIWDQFLKDYPTSQFTELAKTELATWKDRAAKNLVRWGPSWQPKSLVDAHVAKANDFLAEVDSAGPEEASRLVARALAENPYGPEIYFKKGLIQRKAGRNLGFAQALGELLVKADPTNVAALNDLGVLFAQDKQWNTALTHLVRAAVNADNDVVFANLDQVIALAEAAGFSRQALAACEQDVAKQLHEAGKHAGEHRWGAVGSPRTCIRKTSTRTMTWTRKSAASGDNWTP